MINLLVGNVITDIVGGITEWLSGFITMIITSLQSFIALFYVPETGLTTFGYLGLMGIGIGLVFLTINFVRRAFHM